MASGSMKREISETHDTLRFGINAGVKAYLAPPHPLQSTIQSEAKFWANKKKFGTEAIYGSALNIRNDLDAQILSRFQRPPGALPSSLLGYEALTGSLDDFGFEDYLNMPQDSDSFRQPDMHHGMEVRLGCDSAGVVIVPHNCFVPGPGTFTSIMRSQCRGFGSCHWKARHGQHGEQDKTRPLVWSLPASCGLV